jgi:16S rRNA (guanine527-N7)-methyltransferase
MYIESKMFHVEQCNDFFQLIKKWNKAINIVSNNDLESQESFFLRHIEDSIFLSKLLPKGLCVHDLGSGGGLPAIILLIQGFDVSMYEIDKRKSVFLNHVISKMNLSLGRVVNEDVVNVVLFDGVITCRAFADVQKILDITHNKITNKTRLFLIKGQKHQEEINKALSKYNFDFIIHKMSSQQGTVVLEISNIQKNV